MSSRVLLFVMCLALTGCGNLMELRGELKEIDSRLGRIAGTVSSPSCKKCPTILVALGESDSKTVHTYRVLERSETFEMVTFGDSRRVFGFNDLNSDFQFQPNEPAGWVQIPKTFSAGKRVDGINLVLKRDPNLLRPAFGNLFKLRGATLGTIDVRLGTVTDLSHSRFDADFAGLGMWQPLRFMKEGYAGIYFLEPYTPKKIPVLFVHGINGSPRDFSAIIAGLDRRRFQPWVIYYPSGFDIASVGDGVAGMLSELHLRVGFKQMIVVAHSMGGLVTRSYLGDCSRRKDCAYLRGFVSISSPFGGHQAAQSGVDYAPVVLPVWRSMAPDSDFLRQLFVQPLPRQVPHHLIFGFHNKGMLGTRSSDGTITLSSQLRQDAQLQAKTLRGFDEEHVGILGAEAVVNHVNDLIAEMIDRPSQ